MNERDRRDESAIRADVALSEGGGGPRVWERLAADVPFLLADLTADRAAIRKAVSILDDAWLTAEGRRAKGILIDALGGVSVGTPKGDSDGRTAD